MLPTKFRFIWSCGFRGEDFKTFFPIGSYVKTMSTEGGHLGYRTGLMDTILKGDHLRIISAKYGSVVSGEKIFF